MFNQGIWDPVFPDLIDLMMYMYMYMNSHQVNKRLSGEDSEDPKFPKVQFPSHQECPHCKTPKGIWDEEIVSKNSVLHTIDSLVYYCVFNSVNQTFSEVKGEVVEIDQMENRTEPKIGVLCNFDIDIS